MSWEELARLPEIMENETRDSSPGLPPEGGSRALTISQRAASSISGSHVSGSLTFMFPVRFAVRFWTS